jgi:hypothetical protein
MYAAGQMQPRRVGMVVGVFFSGGNVTRRAEVMFVRFNANVLSGLNAFEDVLYSGVTMR